MDIKQLNSLNILYLEDDDSLREKYALSLEILFKNVYQAFDYRSAMYLYNNKELDILLVDINIGRLSGFDFVKKVRQENLEIPIIFLTAFNDAAHILEAVNLDVEGYIVKPLNIEKLQDAMLTCLRKINKINNIQISENIFYSFDQNRLLVEDKSVTLGKKENKLLRMLLKKTNTHVTREELEYEIWGFTDVSQSAIKNLISALRKKIGKEKIINISGVGWRMDI